MLLEMNHKYVVFFFLKKIGFSFVKLGLGMVKRHVGFRLHLRRY
jgi:hypothetical protein